MADDDKKVCSARALKTGETRGSMKECADKKQISYWGVKKADPNIIKSQFENVSTGKDKTKYLSLTGKYQGRLLKLTKDIKFSKDPEIVNKAKGELPNTQRLYDEALRKFTEIDKALKSNRPIKAVEDKGTASEPAKVGRPAKPKAEPEAIKKVGRPATKPKIPVEEKAPVGRPRVNPIIAAEEKKPKGRPKKQDAEPAPAPAPALAVVDPNQKKEYMTAKAEIKKYTDSLQKMKEDYLDNYSDLQDATDEKNEKKCIKAKNNIIQIIKDSKDSYIYIDYNKARMSQSIKNYLNVDWQSPEVNKIMELYMNYIEFSTTIEKTQDLLGSCKYDKKKK